MQAQPPQTSFLACSLSNFVLEVALNNPAKRNSMPMSVWGEFRTVFDFAAKCPDVRAVILRGNGKVFSSGIDISSNPFQFETDSDCAGRQRLGIYRAAQEVQSHFASITECPKPVIAAIHGACFGLAVDLVSWCCIRYATAATQFSIQEVQLGIVSDMGSLLRLPKEIPPGILRELAYTGRKFSAAEAVRFGFLNGTLETEELLLAHVRQLAADIAAQSPLAVLGVKHNINYALDHSVAESRDHVALWNAAHILSNDTTEAVTALIQKRPAAFARL
eukprot:TRINITY_DN4597_c0_g1_i4.p1 TRINITY_DN4597_c0_g1~~TRINITY_DN4597_c0_g1_i4.p1  ORF type:complete len:276 (-),score=64.24 TRINITY_DN4597_c0_g1_i4:2-829(-)